MARLRDVPVVLRTVGPIAFAKRVWKQGSDDQLMTWASALAYAWLFAVFPFFIFLMTLVPELPDRWKATAEREIYSLIKFMPANISETIWSNVQQVLQSQPNTSLLRVIGLLIALWAASGGMSQTMAALDRCYELREGRPFWRHRLVALLMTVVIAALFLLVVILLPVGGIVKAMVLRQDWPHLYAGAPWMVAFDIVRWALAVMLMVSLLTVMYHFGPNVRHRFHWLTPGAVFCIVVWVGLGLVFNYYINRFASYNKTYGTVGGAAVMLIVFYIDAAVLLWGAEINSEIDFEVLKVERGTRDFIPAEIVAEAGMTDADAAATLAASNDGSSKGGENHGF